MAICAMYYIENHKIEVVSTFLGKEKILLNGKTVSEQNSNIGSSHTFTIGKNEYRIAQRDKTYQKRGSIFEVRKNGMPISLVNIRPKTSTQLFVMVIIMGLAFGFTLGILFYNLFWPAMEL
ncbi:hypothetical protein [Maribacter sp. 2308TA10-17]|uniref:hypothetical protein n=1 Tax=Maribacter sp. 2308TA10-17 TaxID=3386276 RepID=UPI0039BCB526